MDHYYPNHRDWFLNIYALCIYISVNVKQIKV